MSVLLDSNVLVHYFHAVEPYNSAVKAWVSGGDARLSVVSISEFLVRALPTEVEGLTQLIQVLGYISIDLSLAKRASELRRQVLRRKSRVLLLDCFLAATAIEHRYQLATLNRKDFPFPELKFATF